LESFGREKLKHYSIIGPPDEAYEGIAPKSIALMGGFPAACLIPLNTETSSVRYGQTRCWKIMQRALLISADARP